MANVLGSEKREQVLALGRLGWSLRRIEASTGVRRETAGRYLRAAGLAVHRRGGEGPAEAKAATKVSSDSAAAPPPPGRTRASSTLRRVERQER